MSFYCDGIRYLLWKSKNINEKAKEHRNCPVPSEVGGSEIYAEAPHPNHYLLLKGRTMHPPSAKKQCRGDPPLKRGCFLFISVGKKKESDSPLSQWRPSCKWNVKTSRRQLKDLWGKYRGEGKTPFFPPKSRVIILKHYNFLKHSQASNHCMASLSCRKDHALPPLWWWVERVTNWRLDGAQKIYSLLLLYPHLQVP